MALSFARLTYGYAAASSFTSAAVTPATVGNTILIWISNNTGTPVTTPPSGSNITGVTEVVSVSSGFGTLYSARASTTGSATIAAASTGASSMRWVINEIQGGTSDVAQSKGAASAFTATLDATPQGLVVAWGFSTAVSSPDGGYTEDLDLIAGGSDYSYSMYHLTPSSTTVSATNGGTKYHWIAAEIRATSDAVNMIPVGF